MRRSKLLHLNGAVPIQVKQLTVHKKNESADKPGSVVDNHSSGRCVTAFLKQPTRTQCEQHLMGSYLALLQVGFALPWNVATHAVRSYRTISPLPHLYIASDEGWAVSFCCTFRRLAPPRCYLAPCSMEPGLSSMGRNWCTTHSDCLADSMGMLTEQH